MHRPTSPEPFENGFPTLPVLSPDEVRRSQAEKYGGLLYLGIGGLVVVVALLGWFGWSAWSLRTVWRDVYVLHDAARPEPERVAAAYELAHDPRVIPRQLWDVALRPSLPPLARYVAAEGLTSAAVTPDPRGYALSVARSEGWPGWLRALLARPLAYAAAEGTALPRAPLEELVANPDGAVALWARYSLAAGGDPHSVDALRAARDSGSPDAELARQLAAALDAPDLAGKRRALDAATLWLRTHGPGAAPLWSGWEVRDGRVVPRRAPDLH